MKNFSIACLLLLSAVGAFVSCDDDTGIIGGNTMPSEDGIRISQAVYPVLTRSVKADSVLATASDGYLGKVVDPETGAITTGDYLSQFYILEDYQLPEKERMVVENGKVVADSVDLRLYVTSYYGDSLNSMKLGVYELDTANVMPANGVFYTNIDPQEYLNPLPSAVHKELAFAVKDLSLPDSTLNSSSTAKSIRVKLPAEYGSFILNKYYENSNNFRNSYNFTHHVCPGFYFKVLSGSGTMITVDVTTLSIYFRYEQDDSTYVGVQRMAATQEVLQNTHIENKNIDHLLLAEDYTFIKSPAGIFTEVTLPVDDIYNEDHLNDTLNSAKIAFPRYNDASQSEYNLSIPQNLLMVKKSELYSFFEKGEVADGETSYLASFSSADNSYTFNNIASLVSHLKNLRNTEAGVTGHETAAERKAKYAAWEAANPDWNKVMLVPVTASYGTVNSSKVLMRVRNDLQLGSTRLLGNGNIQLSVVYSRFKD